MNFFDILKESWISLSANKLRSFLTILGIIIGVAAVICMVSAGQAVQRNVNEQFSSIGTDMLFVRASMMKVRGVASGGNHQTLTYDDLDAIKNNVENILYAVPNETRPAQIVYGNKNWYTYVYGSKPEFMDVFSWKLKDGSFYDNNAVSAMSNYVVLGSEVVNELFDTNENPIGKVVRIKNQPFLVIGVLESKGESMGGQNPDDAVHIPITTFQRKLFGSKFPDSISGITIKVLSENANTQVSEDITNLLRERHKINDDDEDDFQITDMKQIADAMNNVMGYIKILLITIASISLLVGSIGIMNMMLVSVAERTREIGVRKAIGAKEHDIMTQFLTESIMISFFGSLLGLILGIALSQIGGLVLGYTVPISFWSVIISALVALIVGIASGVFPAIKATKLNPIDSLRYE